MNVYFADEQDDPLQSDSRDDRVAERVVALAERVLESERVAGNTEVSIVFVDRKRIATFNERYMGRKGPTDVLAFPIEDAVAGEPLVSAQSGPPLALGDVLICPAVVRENAEESGAEFMDELELMVVHGLLHLLGYDHQRDRDAEVMEERERELLGSTRRSSP